MFNIGTVASGHYPDRVSIFRVFPQIPEGFLGCSSFAVRRGGQDPECRLQGNVQYIMRFFQGSKFPVMDYIWSESSQSGLNHLAGLRMIAEFPGELK